MLIEDALGGRAGTSAASPLERVAFYIKVINALGAAHLDATKQDPLAAAEAYHDRALTLQQTAARCAAEGITYAWCSRYRAARQSGRRQRFTKFLRRSQRLRLVGQRKHSHRLRTRFHWYSRGTVHRRICDGKRANALPAWPSLAMPTCLCEVRPVARRQET